MVRRMSAIGAILHRRGEPVERRALERMRGALKLHGPDRDGIEADGCLGIVWTHTIGFTPEDRLERQPMKLGNGALLVFAGRLNDREELCAALGLPAARVPSLADGELVRRAWETWGERAVERLRGDYALLVADPACRRIVAVRSPLNAPPIYWYEDHGRVVLASMPKGLFALGDIPRELDDQKLADALVLNYQDKDSTFYKNIRLLPIGRKLVAGSDGVEVSRFYDIRNVPRVRLPRDQDYVERARELLDSAVANAMRSIETPAIALSSGLDSTSVAVTALDWLARSGGANAKPLLGLTAVPEPGWDGRAFGAGRVGDESGPVRALMARNPELEVRFVDSAGLSIDHGLDRFQALAEMPLRGVLNLHWGQELRRRARAEGRRVMLSGASGNMTLSQSAVLPVLAGLFRRGRWLHMVREMRAYSAGRGITRGFGLGGLIGLALMPNAPDWLFAAYRRLRPASFEIGWNRFSAIHPDYARDMRVEERMAELGWSDIYKPIPDRRAQIEDVLERGNGHQSAAAGCASVAINGVDPRDPLRERKLFEFCYAIPDEQFFRGGVDRRLVRRLMADRLPREVLGAPRGRQSADWHLRLKRDAGRFEQELDQLEEDADIARRIDLARLRATLRSLPERTPLTRSDHPDQAVMMVGLPRALALARFVRSVKGSNR